MPSSTHSDPDRQHDSRYEIEEAEAWLSFRRHQEDSPAAMGAWDRECYDRAVETDRRDGTHFADIAYPEFAAPKRRMPAWMVDDGEIEDSDNRFAGLNSGGLDIFGRDGW